MQQHRLRGHLRQDQHLRPEQQVRHDQQWTSLGTFVPGTNGYAIVIADDAALATSPDAVQVTLEPAGGSQAPTGAVILAWSIP